MDGSGRATKSITANTPQISDGTLDEREAADVEVPNDRLSPVALGSQLLTVLGLFRRFGDQRAPEQQQVRPDQVLHHRHQSWVCREAPEHLRVGPRPLDLPQTAIGRLRRAAYVRLRPARPGRRRDRAAETDAAVDPLAVGYAEGRPSDDERHH